MVVISSLCFAISLSGTVKDSITEAGLPGTKIIIINDDTGNKDSVNTSWTGSWSYSGTLATEESNPQIISSLSVNQNYPNPFNPSTNIRFSIQKDGLVEIRVTNILGQQVDHCQQYLTAGTYNIKWYNLGAAGMYFYTISSDGKSVTRKMVQLDGGKNRGLAGITPSTFDSKVPDLPRRTVSTPYTLVYSKFGYLNDTLHVNIYDGIIIHNKIYSVHHASTLIDLHNDVLEKMLDDTSYHLSTWHNYNHTDIPRLILGGVDIQMFVVWVNPSDYTSNYYQTGMDAVDIFDSEVAANSNTFGQARTLNEALALNNGGKIAGVLVVEGGHVIENSIQKLINFYEAGMRYMTITWNNSTDWAVSAQDQYYGNTGGLTGFGRQVIHSMDSLGVIIDVSHTGINTIEDILEETSNPIIASHSGVRSIKNHYRNLYDYQIEAIAATGGVIGVVFYPPFLTSGSASINTVIQHIDHIVNLVGIDYVALGSDFDGIGTNVPVGLNDVSNFPNLTLALLDHGYSIKDVEKILGLNFMRVFREVCGE